MQLRQRLQWLCQRSMLPQLEVWSLLRSMRLQLLLVPLLPLVEKVMELQRQYQVVMVLQRHYAFRA